MDWQKLYHKAHEEYVARTYPYAYRDHGAPKTVYPEYDTANGLQKVIKMWCLWTGHFCNRINTQGQVRMEKVKLAYGNVRTNVRWTKGQTTKGTADLDINLKHPAHKFGIPVKAEVKVGKDFQSEEQKDYEKSVTSSGAIYVIIRTPEQWFKFYFDVMR